MDSIESASDLRQFCVDQHLMARPILGMLGTEPPVVGRSMRHLFGYLFTAYANWMYYGWGELAPIVDAVKTTTVLREPTANLLVASAGSMAVQYLREMCFVNSNWITGIGGEVLDGYKLHLESAHRCYLVLSTLAIADAIVLAECMLLRDTASLMLAAVEECVPAAFGDYIGEWAENRSPISK